MLADGKISIPIRIAPSLCGYGRTDKTTVELQTSVFAKSEKVVPHYVVVCAGLMFSSCRKFVHDFIMSLPQGYKTPVGELGDTLSGGERQRLGLARAFLHNAPFMLLDEPTSNLDSLNEAVILKSLKDESRGKTVVLVSHRASTMRIADRVYSVEHGRMS